METPNKIIVNCETGETQIVPLTAEEIKEREADAAAYAVRKAEQDVAEAAKAAAKASAEAKLASLGLTPEEIAAL
jgi:hypothetical protein